MGARAAGQSDSYREIDRSAAVHAYEYDPRNVSKKALRGPREETNEIPGLTNRGPRTRFPPSFALPPVRAGWGAFRKSSSYVQSDLRIFPQSASSSVAEVAQCL